MTTLGQPLLAKRSATPCDGRCGGTIIVVTDGVRNAYVTTEDTQGRYVAQDGIADLYQGVLSVSCQAIDADSGDRCDGGFEVTTHYLTELPWQADEAIRWMEDVTR